MSKYAKFITAAIGEAASVAVSLNLHSPWVAVIVAVATALGVYAVPNKKGSTNVGTHTDHV
jgi:hypothetical protein